jgi:hypothetical protein
MFTYQFRMRCFTRSSRLFSPMLCPIRWNISSWSLSSWLAPLRGRGTGNKRDDHRLLSLHLATLGNCQAHKTASRTKLQSVGRVSKKGP